MLHYCMSSNSAGRPTRILIYLLKAAVIEVYKKNIKVNLLLAKLAPLYSIFYTDIFYLYIR